MLASYIPNMTYAVPAIAGVILIAPLIETGKKYAFLCYLVVSIFSLLFAEPESSVLFILLFGYYPVLKAIIEKLKNIVARYLMKLIVFNASAVAAFYTLEYLVLSDAEIKVSKLIIIGGAIAGNIVFLMYDYGLNGVAFFYCKKVHKTVLKMIKDGRK